MKLKVEILLLACFGFESSKASSAWHLACLTQHDLIPTSTLLCHAEVKRKVEGTLRELEQQREVILPMSGVGQHPASPVCPCRKAKRCLLRLAYRDDKLGASADG